MTTSELLDELNKQRSALDAAIAVIENIIGTTKVSKMPNGKDLLRSIRRYKRKSLHWTQVPKNRKKMLANARRATIGFIKKRKGKGHKWTPEQHEKFDATMKKKYGDK